MINISRTAWCVSLTALSGLFLLGVFILLRVPPSLAQSKEVSNSGANNQNPMTQRGRVTDVGEAKNNSTLKSALAADNLNFDESAMLAPQTDKSQTLLVRLKNQDAVSNKAFSATQSFNTELFLRQAKISDKGVARQRNLELSTTQILIIALGENKEVLWWTLENDPRILRLETADDDGRLSNNDLVYLNEADLLFSLPADDKIAESRFYHPSWNGKEFALELIGSLNIQKR